MVDDGGERKGDTLKDGHAATLATPLPLGPTTLVRAPAAEDLAVGSQTMLALDASRYQLGDVLGQGGMGEVVLAFDSHLGREVAVKRIRAEKPTAEEVARFVREARVQGGLEHPAIVPVHDIAVDRTGRPVFVMKRLSGIELRVLLDRLRDSTEADPVIARRRLFRAFVDVCMAVEFAHSRGIVHRDLKPENIMLGDYGEVYVLDWGISRATGDGADGAVASSSDLALTTGETRAGTVLGTPAYMAPEQLLGERAGPAADIYALGCILYEIAAGAQLHRDGRSIADLVKTADSAPSLRRADSPPELDSICERATATEIAARFTSARALGGAVQAFLDGDRDVAARKELAQHHIAEARAALASGDSDDARRTAMRAAGKALALDPTATDAAELVGQLMLAPPRHVPEEVVHRLEEIDVATGRTQGKIGAIAMTGYLWFIPLLWWTGIRDARVIIAFAIVALLSAGQIYWMTHKNVIPHAAIYTSAVINAVLIGLVCRMVGPFIIAPTLVLTTLMAYAVHPRFGQIRIIAAILTAGVAVPWLLEVAGVLSPTYEFVRGSIVLTSPSVEFSAQPVQLAFAVLLVLLAAVVAVLLRSMATRQREVTQQIELQSWHLRQVVRPG
jgi:tRNA A-37 threonylcarbamoyl transferase component Bud32